MSGNNKKLTAINVAVQKITEINIDTELRNIKLKFLQYND
jgi:uncharacterized membrane protein